MFLQSFDRGLEYVVVSEPCPAILQRTLSHFWHVHKAVTILVVHLVEYFIVP